MSDSMPPHRRQPTRLPCPQNSLGKNTGVGCHFLSRDLFLDFFFTKNLWDDLCESHSVVSNSLRPHGLQQARLACPSPTPRAWEWRQIWTKLRIWQVKVHGRLAGLGERSRQRYSMLSIFCLLNWLEVNIIPPHYWTFNCSINVLQWITISTTHNYIKVFLIFILM